MGKAKLSLAWQIVIGLALGIAVGAVLNHFSAEKAWWIANVLQPAGDIFIRLIKMIVVPIVISSLVVGIAGVGDAKKLGRIGLKTIIYFEIVTTVAIVVGLLLANLFQPGTGIDMSTLGTVDISQYQKTTQEVQHDHAFIATILNLIPSNVFAAIARGEMLPIIFFSVMFGLGLSSLPNDLREPLVKVFQGVSETMFKVTHMIMKYAPIGVFAPDRGDRRQLRLRLAAAAGQAGDPGLRGHRLLRPGGAGPDRADVRLSIMRLIRIFKDDLVLAYSTASSETVLPRIIEKMEAYGAPKAISSFVVPTGYSSFNLDGSTLYQSIAAIFIRAALRHRPVHRPADHAGADPDGDLQGYRRRAGRVLRGAARHPGQRRHPARGPGLHRRRGPHHGHGAYRPQRDRQCPRGAGHLQVGRHVRRGQGQRYWDSLPHLRQAVGEAKGKQATLE